MPSAALLLAVLLAHQYTAAGEIESFSAGGAYLVDDGAAAWLVSLRYSGDRDGRAFKDYPYCGGSVLNATHVLTAARCLKNPAVQDLNSPLIAAQAGSVHRNKVRDTAAQVQPIAGFAAHRAYNPNRKYFDQRYDIAVAKVAQPFNLTTQVRAVPLRKEAAPAGTRCQVYGWGDIVEANGTEYSKGSTRAKFVEVVIMAVDECAAKYNRKVTELEGLVCTIVPDGKKFSCLGDSGGALLCDGQLTGVTPEGVRCGPNEERPDLPDLHVDTVQLLHWIETGGTPSSATACLLLTLLASATAVWWH